MSNEELSDNHVYLKNIIDNPNIVVGDYTFYHDFNDPKNFPKYNAGYFDVPTLKEKLYIEKYCSLAHGVMFLSSVVNHPMDGFSTYPFSVVWGDEATGTSYK